MPEGAKNGDTVRVHYTGRLEGGEVFDSSAGGDPLEFTVGTGQVIAGFDAGVRGMQVGDEKRIEIEADDAYGQPNEAFVGRVERDRLPLDEEPQVGMQLALQMPDGQQIPFRVTEVTADMVTIDANHPLAGEKLIFDLELVGIGQDS